MRKGEEVYAFVDPKTKEIYLNPEFFATTQALEAPIHEFTHLGVIACEKINKPVYDRGMQLAMELLSLRGVSESGSSRNLQDPKTPSGESNKHGGVQELVDKILNDRVYSAQSREAQAQELLAQLSGKRGEEALRAETDKTVIKKIKSWLVEFWNTFGKALGLKDITPDEAAKMTLEQVADAIRAELMGGGRYGEGFKAVEFADGGAKVATRPERMKRKLTGRRKSVNEFIKRMGGAEDPTNSETDMLALWVDNGGRLFDKMPFEVSTGYSKGKTGVKKTRSAVADEFAESTAFYKDLDAAQRKVFFGTEKLESGSIGESLREKLEAAGITRFTREDGTVDYEAAIEEFKRQWTNYERGAEFLKERGEYEEARDRAYVEEMERAEAAEREAGDQISAEEAAARDEAEKSGMMFSRADDLAFVEIPKAATSYKEARDILRRETGKRFTNVKSGLSASLSGNSINKILSGKAVAKSVGIKQHLAAAANIVELFEGGELRATEEGNRKGVKAAKRVFARFDLEGEKLVAKITVLEHERNDHRIYSVEAMEVAKAGSILAPKDSMSQAENPALPSTEGIIANSSEGEQGGRKLLFSIGGRSGAKNLGIGKMDEAEAMEKSGADRKDIWRKTGWWRGKDGKWRVELPDVRRGKWHGDPEERHFRGGGEDFYRYNLTELIEDGDFLKAYPQARKIKIEFHKNMPENVGGNFNEQTLTIKLPQKYQILTDYAKAGLGEGKAASLNEAGRKSIVHELQHAIQLFESFAKGGSPTEPVRHYALDGNTGHALSVFGESIGMDPANRKHLAIIANWAQKITSDYTRDDVPKRIVEKFEAAAKEAGKTPQEFRDEIERFYDSHTETPMGQYYKLEGEVEARNAQARLGMTAEERAATPPWETEDVPENRQLLFSRGGIFTGTAADYANRSRQGGKDDGPSLKKIGTGEGSQVYGWGLYGSTVRGVAEGYAMSNGGKFGKTRWRKNGEEPKTQAEIIATDWLAPANGNPKKAIKLIKDRMETVKALGLDVKPYLEAIKDLRDHGDAYSISGTHLYEQTFFTDRAPGDESHLLKWYDAISDANWDRVIAQAEKEGLRDKLKGAWWLRFNGDLEHFITDNGNSGDAIYERLSKLLGTPQAASEFLARAGIDGVKYPVDSYGGKGVKDGDKAGWNYVSFRDDNIRVDHKWTDGQLLFSRAVKPSALGDGKQRYYEVPFDKAVDKIVKNKKPIGNEHVFVGPTPQPFSDIGLPKLPIMMGQGHVISCYFGKGEGVNVEHLHNLKGKLKLLPKALERPLMIIPSESSPADSVVAIIKMQDATGASVIVPVQMSGVGRVGTDRGTDRVDAHIVLTMFGKKNAWKQLVRNAVKEEASGGVGIFYADKNEAKTILNRLAHDAPGIGRSELQSLSGSISKGTVHSIADDGSPVNRGIVSQTATRQFKNFFGKSKVVDANGEPLVVYRRDNDNFTVFDFNKTQQNDAGWLGKGFYFYGDKGEAERSTGYGKNLRAFYLKAENPYYITADEYNRLVEADDPKISAEFTERLKDEGYDSVYWNGDGRQEWMAFEPSQVKSATDNIGSFDPGNNDIRFSRGTAPEVEHVKLTRVADDAGQGEQTPGTIAASAELSRTVPTPLSQKGTRYVSLPVSEMVALTRYLNGHAESQT